MKAFLILIFTFSLFAQTSPDEVKIITPKYDYNLSNFKPLIGKYTYNVSWASIPAALITVDVARSGDGLKVTTSAQTSSGIDLLYKLRFEAQSQIDENFLPVRANIFSQENSKIKKSQIRFSGVGYINSTRDFSGRPREEYTFNSGNQTFDPVSASFLARTFDWNEGDEKEFDVFNGKTRYLIKFKSLGSKDILFNNQIIPCFVIQPIVKKLNPVDNSKPKLRSANIYITKDSKRDILKIESDVFIGKVNTELVKFEEKNDIILAKKISR